MIAGPGRARRWTRGGAGSLALGLALGLAPGSALAAGPAAAPAPARAGVAPVAPVAPVAGRPTGGVADTAMIRIPGGSFRPLYRQPVRGADRDTVLRRVVPVRVAPFLLDRFPVTNAQYLAFVAAHPEWRRSRVSRLFADRSYLAHWRGDLDPGPTAPLASPVVDVSWFAARACLAAQGKRLPTVAEWELAAAADERVPDATRDRRFLERIRAWSSRPTPAVQPAVGGRFRNLWGVEDLHGLVWEWTLDFNSALVTGESRGDASLERSLYCGAGATNAGDFGDYAAFMRFAFRASLEANYTTGNLGFRGARDLRPPAPTPAPASGKDRR